MKALTFSETKKILSEYDIPFGQMILAKSKKEAIVFAEKIGYPVVLKVSSPEILHKTEIEGIKTNIFNKKNLEKTWDKILSEVKKKKPLAKIEGILVQKQLKGREVVIGMKRDRQFGPVLMFGLGGIFTEVLEDVAFKIAPVSESDAMKMIKEIKGYKVLTAFRGQKPVNLKAIVKIIVSLSRLSLEKEEIKEIDLNPIIVNEKRALIVDTSFLL